MNFEVVRNELRGKLKQLSSTGKLLLAVASDTWAHQRQRIFTEGETTSGRLIKPSSKPTLAGRGSFPNQKGFLAFAGSREKRKKLKWVTIIRNGKKLRLFVVPGGYKEIKRVSGRNNPMDFTGQLKKSYTYELKNSNLSVMGFAINNRLDTKGRPSDNTNTKIVEGLEDKFGQIFSISNTEKENIDRIIDNELTRIFR